MESYAHNRETTERPPGDAWVVVPAFNEAGMIASTVGAIVDAGHRCVVVDDASSDQTYPLSRRAGATVIRHLINRGQGAALETGIRFCLNRGATRIVTFDADGQHDAADIGPLIGPLVADEADIVLGSRFLGSAPNIPRTRRSALRVAILISRLSSGLPVTDTHNGLRAMNRKAADAITISMDRMAHASEILDQIRRHDLRFTEVPVTIRYTPYSLAKGQSNTMAAKSYIDYLINKVLG